MIGFVQGTGDEVLSEGMPLEHNGYHLGLRVEIRVTLRLKRINICIYALRNFILLLPSKSYDNSTG